MIKNIGINSIFMYIVLSSLLIILHIAKIYRRNHIEITRSKSMITYMKKNVEVRKGITKNIYIQKEINIKPIFIHIPKNAGSYIRKYVKGENNSYDHMDLNMLYVNFREVFNNHTFFCVVRNPYDRLVSNYEFALKRSNTGITQSTSKEIFDKENIATFEDFVYFLHSNHSNLNKVVHWHPQYTFITVNNTIPPKQKLSILRFENISEDFKQFLDERNISVNISTEKVNAVTHKDYKEYYKSKDIISKVNDIYRKDFEYFKYDFM